MQLKEKNTYKLSKIKTGAQLGSAPPPSRDDFWTKTLDFF